MLHSARIHTKTSCIIYKKIYFVKPFCKKSGKSREKIPAHRERGEDTWSISFFLFLFGAFFSFGYDLSRNREEEEQRGREKYDDPKH